MGGGRAPTPRDRAGFSQEGVSLFPDLFISAAHGMRAGVMFHSSLLTPHFSLFTSHPLGFGAAPCYNRLVNVRERALPGGRTWPFAGNAESRSRMMLSSVGGVGPRARCPLRPWKPPRTSQQLPRRPAFAPLVANRWPSRVPHFAGHAEPRSTGPRPSLLRLPFANLHPLRRPLLRPYLRLPPRLILRRRWPNPPSPNPSRSSR